MNLGGKRHVADTTFRSERSQNRPIRVIELDHGGSLRRFLLLRKIIAPDGVITLQFASTFD